MKSPRGARGAASSEEVWQFEEAMARFGAVVDAAVAGQPQPVMRGGEPVVVIIAAEDYERLSRLEKAKLPPFTEFLLDMPQDDGDFDRLPLAARHIDP